MSAVMNIDDMKTTRSMLRWAGMGVMPSPARAAAAVDMIRAFDGRLVDEIRAVADSAARGVIPSQQACQKAQTQLQVVFDQVRSGDEEQERDRG